MEKLGPSRAILRDPREIRKIWNINAYIHAGDLQNLDIVCEDLFRIMCIGEATREELLMFVYAEHGRYAILSFLWGQHGYHEYAQHYLDLSITWGEYYTGGDEGLHTALDDILEDMLGSEDARTVHIQNILDLDSSIDERGANAGG